MNTKNFLPVFVLALLVSLSSAPFPASAKETSQNFILTQTLSYFWNRWNSNSAINLGTESQVIQQSQAEGSGWQGALTQPNVTIFYRARIVDNVTGTVITDGANLAVGSVVRLEFEPHLSTDISWFGTGASMDSPYGEWRAGATPPALTSQDRGSGAGWLPTCESKDFVNNTGVIGLNFGVYIPFVVSPPSKSITTSSNLSCGAPDGSGNRTCTVTAAGPISVSFDFAPTTGKFYYRYTDQRTLAGAPGWSRHPGCYGNNVALRPSSDTAYISQSAPVCWTECQTVTCVPPTTDFEYGDSGTYNGDGRYCFSGDTPVLLADGGSRVIQDIRIGDYVLGEDIETGERVKNLVVNHIVHEGSFPTLIINGSITVTGEHEIKILRDGEGVWVPARSIKVGDELFGETGMVMVESVTEGEVLSKVYNLTTVPSHTYFAGGVLVHNVKGGGGGGQQQLN